LAIEVDEEESVCVCVERDAQKAPGTFNKYVETSNIGHSAVFRQVFNIEKHQPAKISTKRKSRFYPTANFRIVYSCIVRIRKNTKRTIIAQYVCTSHDESVRYRRVVFRHSGRFVRLSKTFEHSRVLAASVPFFRTQLSRTTLPD